jgi:hypothetical protein
MNEWMDREYDNTGVKKAFLLLAAIPKGIGLVCFVLANYCYDEHKIPRSSSKKQSVNHDNGNGSGNAIIATIPAIIDNTRVLSNHTDTLDNIAATVPSTVHGNGNGGDANVISLLPITVVVTTAPSNDVNPSTLPGEPLSNNGDIAPGVAY